MAAYETHAYGSHSGQEADLYRAAADVPVVCLLHGGFWRLPHGRDQMHAVAEDLQVRGYTVWNIGYRRLGQPGSGWPGTFDDVLSAIDYLPRADVNVNQVILCGHSAGGHLALWAAAKRAPATGSAVVVRAAIGQAPLADLAQAHAQGLGSGAVAELLSGTHEAWIEVVREASPGELIPLRVPQLVIHGADDEVVPPALSRSYAAAAQRAGDVIELCEVSGSGHMDFLEPDSQVHQILCDRLTRLSHQQAL